MLIETTRFGKVEIDGSRVITFKDGPLGFPHHRRFALIQTTGDDVFFWMQSLEDAELAFLVCDPVVYVPDASRSVAVATQLVGEAKADFVAARREEYAQVRERVANRQPRSRQRSYEEAVAHGLQLDWAHYTPPRPTFIGTRVFEDFPIEELVDTIDWTPFFITWELAGKYPDILEDEVVGRQATELEPHQGMELGILVDLAAYPDELAFLFQSLKVLS